MLFKKKNNKKFISKNISLDEIFLDSKNIPNFNTHQFEGKMEKPIGPKVFLSVGAGFLLLILGLFFRVGYLQIVNGETYADRAERNRLRLVYLYPERGVIYDRNGEDLAWNNPSFNIVLEKSSLDNKDFKNELSKLIDLFGNETYEDVVKRASSGRGDDIIINTFYDWNEISEAYVNWSHLPIRIEAVSSRSYKNDAGMCHVLGYISYPSAEDIKKQSLVLQNILIGKSGVEESLEADLRGEYGLKLIEIDSMGDIKSESIQKNPVSGDNIYLSIDSRVQGALYNILEKVSNDRGFGGAAGVIMNVNNGEILAMTSYPEYDPQVLTRGGPEDVIDGYINNPQKPFLNRAISGLYAPGSIIKPFVALASLNEGIINPLKQIYSSGSISVPNPYFPDEPSVFYDWKAHGLVDMRRALAVSSNVYFYTIGGGFEDVGGLGIKRIRDYMYRFGFGKETGIDLRGESVGTIPGPDDSGLNTTGEIWRIGDTYHASIGQGDFQVTPIQVAVGVSMIANGGKLIKPKVILNSNNDNGEGGVRTVNIPYQHFVIVREGMRESATEGTAQALGGLPVKIAAKTGTAEIGSKERVNSWLVAFWPYDNPKYALAIVLEKGDVKNLIGGVFAGNELFKWMIENTPEYID